MNTYLRLATHCLASDSSITYPSLLTTYHLGGTSSPSTTRPSPLTTHHSSLMTHYSPLTTHHSPLTTHCSLLTTHYSLLTTHHSLPTNHYSLLTTHESLLTTHYPRITNLYSQELTDELTASQAEIMRCRHLADGTNALRELPSNAEIARDRLLAGDGTSPIKKGGVAIGCHSLPLPP